MRCLIALGFASLCGCSVLGAMWALVGLLLSCWQAYEWILFASLMTIECSLVAMFFWRLANVIWPNRSFAG